MKKNIIISVLTLSIAFLLNSCDRKVEFQSVSFATFDVVKYSVKETAGEMSIPVSIYNPSDQEIQLIIKTKDSTAVAGKDFNVTYPVNGVLTFAPGESTKNIEIELIHDKARTGSKIFEVMIASADDSFAIGQFNTATCKIRDKEHPLEKFIGEWSGDVFDLSANAETILNVTIDEDEYDDSFTKLRVSNLDPIASKLSKTYTLRATVNAEQTKITIANEQPIGYYDAYATYYTFYGFSLSSDGYVSYANGLTLVYNQSNETLTIEVPSGNSYGTLYTYTDGNDYIGSLYSAGCVLTKK